MILAAIFIAATAALAIFAVRKSTDDNLHKRICLLFSPFVIVSLAALVLPTYWFLTTGRFASIADDLEGMGSILILFAAIPVTLILNLVIYACRKIENEAPS